MPKAYQLTKSKYCKGLNCPKALYLSVHQSNLATPPGPAQQLRFDEGTEVGILAQKEFVGGVLIEEDHTQLAQAVEATQTCIGDKSIPAIFEATFIHDGVLCRVDILKRNPDDSWDIYEVKSTKEAKEEHEDDVAIQLWVLEHCGLKVRNVFLKHINPEFICPNWNEYFMDTDLTDAARFKVLKEVDSFLSKQKLLLSQAEMPDVHLGSQCGNPYVCEFKDYCWKDVPAGSSLELYRSKKKYDIYYNQYEFIHEIDPKQIKLTEFQNRQWLASKQDEPIVNLEGIRKELLKLQFPLYFIDFETVAFAIPFLDGMKSYQRLPVQWSCHLMISPESEVEHIEYLVDVDSSDDPRVACAKSLDRLFQRGFGTLIAYHQSFEIGVLNELADQVPEFEEILRESVKNFWDLEQIFQKSYYHQDMAGSCSIKSVLPHFAPELSYKDLEVQDGGSAEATLNKMVRGLLPADEVQARRHQLLKYCKRDTEAMLVILENLLDLTKVKLS
ncbi:MAG: hypothetical protein COV44_10695 [Deltaproteobacteria bacterium CG11_big_fil_rev_8_21_14_0_20_45_16]|nr:MAG: hypothetical protein COV44_10695 [Deltaproteobacteria bacterium CG11_big_fil_rev_8_21_14_0_20_45_16]